MEISQGGMLQSELRGKWPKDRASTRITAPAVTSPRLFLDEESFLLGWNHGLHEGCVVNARAL